MGDDTTVVLDAYALGVVHDIPEVAEKWSGRLVLTPNRHELERLLDLDADELGDAEALPQAVGAAPRRFCAVVTCRNVIAGPDTPVWRCGPNCIGLGTSGSGDVLAGAILGLLGPVPTPLRRPAGGLICTSCRPPARRPARHRRLSGPRADARVAPFAGGTAPLTRTRRGISVPTGAARPGRRRLWTGPPCAFRRTTALSVTGRNGTARSSAGSAG